MRIGPDQLLRGADLAATLLFAIEGANVAVSQRLDVFGMLVLAFATALGGGIVRDVLLGDLPPAALRSTEYAATAFVGGGIVFVVYQAVQSIPFWLITALDAAGLGLFCVAGAAKALDHGMNLVTSVLLGTITGCGGGVIRDIMANRVPGVLQAHIYAVAAAVGACALVLLCRAGVRRGAAMALGASCCVLLRVLSLSLHWNLPHVNA